MDNDEIIYNLNSETQDYLDNVFSIMDKLDGNISDEDKFCYANLIYTVKDNILIKPCLNKNNIFYDDIAIEYDDEKLAINCESYIKIDLSNLIQKTIEMIKFNYCLDDADIQINNIEPYQIFDYIMSTNNEYLKSVINDKLKSDYDDIKEKLHDELHPFYELFVVNNDVDLDNEFIDDFNSSSNFEFNNLTIYVDKNDSFITFNSGDKLKSFVNSISSDKINGFEDFINKNKFPQTFKLLTIDGEYNIDKYYIEDNILDKTKTQEVVIEIQSMFKDDIYLLKLDRQKAFTIQEEEEKLFENEEDDYTRDYTPNLNKYGYDLTKEDYVKDPSIDREDEIRRLEQILLYPERDKSIMIVGDAGCGKTALVRGLAYRIKNGDVPKALKKLRIISIDTSTLVAGTKYVGTLEEKMMSILEEASASKDIVLFIDEIHQTLGGGKAEGNDNSVSEILKPYIDYGRVRIIGSTTTDEYIEYVESDAAFKSRFKKLSLKEPDRKVIYSILDDLITSYNKLSEKKNIICPKLDLDDDKRRMIINWLIDSTADKHRVHDDKVNNPRLVLDIIKEAYAIATFNEKDIVTIEDIATALSLEERLNKSFREEEADKLIKLEQNEKLKRLMKEENITNNNIIQFKLKKKF